jgi:acetyl esterase/lipase
VREAFLIDCACSRAARFLEQTRWTTPLLASVDQGLYPVATNLRNLPMSYRYDPEIAPVVPLLPELDLDDITAARSDMETLLAALGAETDASGLGVEEQTIEGPDGSLRVRVYSPRPGAGATPGLLYIHGGGFVLGNLESEHASAIAIARALGIVIVSVDYRLAPEHPYPAGLHDCESAFLWCIDNAAALGIDPGRLGVFGQSAGGGLAAGLCLLRRDRGGPQPCFQFLGIPELDDRLQTASMRAFTDTPMWSRPKAELSWRYYLGDIAPAGANVPAYAAPARAKDLSGVPPACVTVMEFDPLRDEGIAYAQALLQAGVQTELHCYPGTFHGSSLVRTAAISRRQEADMLAALTRGLGLPGEPAA